MQEKTFTIGIPFTKVFSVTDFSAFSYQLFGLAMMLFSCEKTNWNFSLHAVGRPIELTKKPHPTKEELLYLQTIYIEMLQELFDEHKRKHAWPGCKLVTSWRTLLPEHEYMSWRMTMRSVALCVSPIFVGP